MGLWHSSNESRDCCLMILMASSRDLHLSNLFKVSQMSSILGVAHGDWCVSSGRKCNMIGMSFKRTRRISWFGEAQLQRENTQLQQTMRWRIERRDIGSIDRSLSFQSFFLWRSDFLEIHKNVHSGWDVSFAVCFFHSDHQVHFITFLSRTKKTIEFRCSQSAARASPGLRSLLNSFGFFSLAHTYRVSWSSGTNVDLRKYTVAVYHLGHFNHLRRKNRMASKFTFSTQLGYSRKNSAVWGYKSLD